MKSGGQWMISQSSAESDCARVSSCVPGQEAIYRVVPELNQVAVYARHIFYDLLDNMVKSLKPLILRDGGFCRAGIGIVM